MKIALVTCAKHPQLFAEEQQLPQAFARAGADAKPVVWDAPHVDWTSFDAIVLRTTWDYVAKITAFREWLEQLRGVEARGVRVINPLELIEWNIDKSYLATLERAGVPIVPTEFLPQGAVTQLAPLLGQRGWSRAVIKPSISAGAFRTHVVNGPVEAASLQSALEKILRSSGALVQPFMTEIETAGELSFVAFGGELAYALVKKPAAGDFRVQFTHGGTYERVALESVAGAARTALQVLDALPAKAAYARIDGVLAEGELIIMEAELIEPYLHLSIAPETIDRYVAAILAAAAER